MSDWPSDWPATRRSGWPISTRRRSAPARTAARAAELQRLQAARRAANRGHASIGYGVPGAIGAKLAAPDRVVAELMGDGGLGMSIGEFETAVRLGQRGLVFVVVDNEASGYVKALQHSLFADRFQSVDSIPVNYARVAQEFGLHAERVDDPAQLAGALHRAMAADRPALVDVAGCSGSRTAG
jgi:thiamine pyrophosphate-dependent acetolactate synthase large subunit-like protein